MLEFSDKVKLVTISFLELSETIFITLFPFWNFSSTFSCPNREILFSFKTLSTFIFLEVVRAILIPFSNEISVSCKLYLLAKALIPNMIKNINTNINVLLSEVYIYYPFYFIIVNYLILHTLLIYNLIYRKWKFKFNYSLLDQILYTNTMISRYYGKY